MFCKKLLTEVSSKLHLMCRALSVSTHLQMILCFSNRGLLFVVSKVKLFLISYSYNCCTSTINISCFKCSNASSASHAQIEMEFSFLDWNCHYRITTNQNKSLGPFTFFCQSKNVHISPCDLISAAILLPGPTGVWREGREVQMSRKRVFSLRNSAFAE